MNFKKLTSDAATVFNRAVQFTEEKLGKAERTEFDAPLENLIQRANRTEEHTKKILGLIETYLRPDLTQRLEGAFYETLDIRKEANKQRINNLEYLGQAMNEAGNEFGPETEYGSALLKVANTQYKLGTAEREFDHAAMINVLTPLKRFLEGEMKTVSKEKKTLLTKRLDLDALKARLKKSKATDSPASTGAEAEVRIAQSEFDKQSEILKLLLEGVETAKASHLRVLRDFVDAQTAFYAQAHQHMADLQRELSSAGPFNAYATSADGFSQSSYVSSNAPPAAGYGQQQQQHYQNNVGYHSQPNYANLSGPVGHPAALDPADMGTKRAQAMFDYDAMSSNELSIRKGDALIIYRLPGLDPELVMAEKGTQRGRIPLSYIEICN